MKSGKQRHSKCQNSHISYLDKLCRGPEESLERDFNCETGWRCSAENTFYYMANYMLLRKYEEVQITYRAVLEGCTKI